MLFLSIFACLSASIHSIHVLSMLLAHLFSHGCLSLYRLGAGSRAILLPAKIGPARLAGPLSPPLPIHFGGKFKRSVVQTGLAGKGQEARMSMQSEEGTKISSFQRTKRSPPSVGGGKPGLRERAIELNVE